ncbi:glutamate-5-semialdehyde dehydrogenase [Priestia megaterium]|uniref:Gamma-glutamyl phosphate reductase n=1 Tax=Priestia megaterium (strain ATCC 14581 / DSM 32 / CCUG 1817 / JCM 2506 / NBRC 15308 / NCIMB 9376 / NCTC 10342 / NRRL B-14308 / VKM B-512 / Ford 19) TaxID=1348623 RepID=A0A0B6AVW8_PRIM2|nr:glutamate-5-semialdehyde dehydrogenase [Priestia megaterium]AJI24019.1 glutamate-5-semialdehyde dehydrogenase [Priestia megaterium NBRC 15308 = ATCC 14581]KFN06671.1 glutamate-5-semialdehyde dehydrogenase [Priestia megaterium]KGJ85094.1 gamma-glutamyl phosphate reductase [Priestia megaterium NBRC 15308 = ATCC 14581]MDR4233497.1 glutamate-5-semialdehyde dehydrogenase [Priestia megaterium]MED3807001.1 glutamate-5-semialdehyde dehydrogenase [Priestia megaterium]
MSELQLKGKQAKEASYFLGNVTSEQKQQALYKMAAALLDQQEAILKANKLDVEKAIQKGTSKAMLDRLSLNEERIHGMADGLRQVAALADPVGEVLSMAKRPNGLQIGQQRVPIGVIGIIYEARPNVTCDATGLCLKAGNAVILRGGSEAFYSNQAIVSVLSQAAASAGLPEHSVQLIENTSRETALELMKLNEYIDVLIPRGGAGLIEAVVKNATVPVIETGTGNCHIYVDEEYDGDMAANIVINAKTSRPAVCNSAEKLLIHKRAAHEFLPIIVQALREKDVEVRGDERAVTIVPDLVPAGDEDWKKEYLDFIMAVKIVDDIDEAISHINVHSSHHSEAIVTTNYAHAQRFLQRVNSAAVYVNASTRFTDGEEFGFGAEIGISTQKLHARGPMGLKELTTLKYIIYGDGQIR